MRLIPAVCVLALGVLSASGCEKLEYREGVYACTPGEADTCPEDWVCLWSDADSEHRCYASGTEPCGPQNCAGCCAANGDCVAGILDTQCGSGGQACESCTGQTMTCDGGGCVACVCTTGICCDGCGFLPDTHQCDLSPVDVELRCDGTDCGAQVQQREQLRYCTGAAADCGNDNLVWGDWVTVETCGPNAVCWADEVGAGCDTCLGGCAAGACLCYDPDSDLYGQGCVAGLDCDDTNSDVNEGASEVCANCLDENCDGSDLGCDGTEIIFTPPQPLLGDTVTVRVESPLNYPFVCLAISSPQAPLHDGAPELTGSDPGFWVWENVITLDSPGTYRFEFWMNWNTGPSCDPNHEVKVCHEIVVN